MNVEEVRAAATVALEALEHEPTESGRAAPVAVSAGEPTHCRYWLGGFQRPLPDDASHACRCFQTNGFLHVKRFVSTELCQQMKDAMTHLVLVHWHPDDDPSNMEAFGTDDRQNTALGDYFLDSADKIHFFAEPAALVSEDTMSDSSSKNNKAQSRLRPEYQGSNRVLALNKAGHGLHLNEKFDDGTPNIFHTYCTSPKLRELVKDLGWHDPVVPQSMYIFKQATTGGVVNSHQDSTFLFTTPTQTCLGLWLALDDATLENGCLWVRPKSHKEPVRRQYKRNPLYFGADKVEADSGQTGNGSGDASAPMFVMEDLYEHNILWDGAVPKNGMDGLLEAGFVPVECKAGDLVVFCGELDHLSLPNRSNRARHTFQLHLVEGPSQNVTWSPSNWLQYNDHRPFTRLFATSNDD